MSCIFFTSAKTISPVFICYLFLFLLRSSLIVFTFFRRSGSLFGRASFGCRFVLGSSLIVFTFSRSGGFLFGRASLGCRSSIGRHAVQWWPVRVVTSGSSDLATSSRPLLVQEAASSVPVTLGAFFRVCCARRHWFFPSGVSSVLRCAFPQRNTAPPLVSDGLERLPSLARRCRCPRYLKGRVFGVRRVAELIFIRRALCSRLIYAAGRRSGRSSWSQRSPLVPNDVHAAPVGSDQLRRYFYSTGVASVVFFPFFLLVRQWFNPLLSY